MKKGTVRIFGQFGERTKGIKETTKKVHFGILGIENGLFWAIGEKLESKRDLKGDKNVFLKQYLG